MDVKFITTTAEKLSAVPVVNGQIIALSDQSAYYYDMGDERRCVSGQMIVDKLPEIGQTGIWYISLDQSEEGMYLWDGEKFMQISKLHNVMYITLSTDDNGTITSDKSFAEIKNHVNTGGVAIAFDASNYWNCQMSTITDEVIMFDHFGIIGTSDPVVHHYQYMISNNDSVMMATRALSFSGTVLPNLETENKTIVSAINEVKDIAEIQSDWGENDESKSSHILNRSHYEDRISYITWDGLASSATDTEFVESEYLYRVGNYPQPPSGNLDLDDTYVLINGQRSKFSDLDVLADNGNGSHVVKLVD